MYASDRVPTVGTVSQRHCSLALARGHRWLAPLDAGKAKMPADIARLEAMNIVQVREILRLTLLAPDIIEAIVDVRAPRWLTLEFLLRRSIPREWEEQRRLVESTARGNRAERSQNRHTL